MYKKMLVLLDGSELAEVVFEYAQELSGRLHIDLELLNVCSQDEASQLPMRRAYIERMAEVLCEKAEKVRAEHDDTAACILAHGRVVVGYPADEILKYVDENDIDLIMMSTHGSSGKKEWDLGGVANKIVHASKVPVWLVPADLRAEVITDSLPVTTTLVPLSGEKGAEVAMKHVLGILEQKDPARRGQVVLLTVVDEPLSAISQYTTTSTLPTELDKRMAKAQKYLEDLAEPLRTAGLTVHTEALWGDPAAGILDYLKDNPINLLVLATRGKSRINRMVFGSVSESLIHSVKVTPLLLVGEDG